MAVEVDKLIRRHNEEGFTDVGVIVWVERRRSDNSESERQYMYIEAPSKTEYKNAKMQAKGERSNGFFKKPRVGFVKDLSAEIDDGKISLIDQVRPAYFFYSSTEDFIKDKSKSLLRYRSRRDLQKWLKRRDADLKVLKTLTRKDSVEELIEGDLVSRRIATAVKSIDTKAARDRRSRELHQLWRKWLYFGRAINSLLPQYGHCGNPGAKKFASTPTGRDNKAKFPRFIMTKADAAKCRAGWKRAMKEKKTDEQAAQSVWNEFYAASISWPTRFEPKVVLLPAHQRPTMRQIKRAYETGSGEESSARIRMGQNTWLRHHRPLLANNGSRTVVLGQLGVLDATSEDQRPVSEASRLRQLPSSWRTMVVDARWGYIYGVYRGFEKGGTLPGLMALLHAAEPKDDWFNAIMDRPLKPGEWYSIVFKRVLGDAGDLKNKEAITTMTLSEMSAEFTRSYAAEHKVVEPKHKSMHRRAGHRLEASTKGKTQSRGDDDQGDQCIKFSEGWPPLIAAILHHNNVELVPHLLTLEMREYFEEHGLAATRQNIVWFCMEFGYVTSEPSNLSVLRTQCLPKLAAKIHRNGLHVFDPREPVGKRYVPGLIYDSEWLHASGLKGTKLKDCEVHIDPSGVGAVFLKTDDGVQRLTLRTPDDEMRSLTLADWLSITDCDALRAFAYRDEEESAAASATLSIDTLNKEAKKEKAAEAQAARKAGAKKQSTDRKRQNLADEEQVKKQQELGVHKVQPKKKASNVLDLDAWLLSDDESPKRTAA